MTNRFHKHVRFLHTSVGISLDYIQFESERFKSFKQDREVDTLQILTSKNGNVGETIRKNRRNLIFCHVGTRSYQTINTIHQILHYVTTIQLQISHELSKKKRFETMKAKGKQIVKIS